MIRIFLLLCAWSLNAISQAQITLESCKQQARENYPLVRQYDLIQLSEQYTLSNVAKGMGHRTKRFFQWSGKMGERF